MIRRFEMNLKGRDFVVGDLHGAYEQLSLALLRARFDPQTDRLFSVGDLVDRGPASHRCVEFLSQPWMHAVRGNHEDMLLELHADGEPAPEVLHFLTGRNGMQWWRDVSPEDRACMLNAFRKLPMVIEIETPRGLVGLIHAEVPHDMSWSEFKDAIKSGDDKVINSCLWGRNRIKRNDMSGVEGVGRLYVGHTPLDRLERFGNVWALDTGLVYGVNDPLDSGHLTLLNATASTTMLACPPKPADRVLAIADPGGAYAFS